MTDPPYRSGDFVWSNYPERENPSRPGPRHSGYVALSTSSESVSLIVMAYTTSRQSPGARRPIGVYNFNQSQAAEMGQSRPFTLDLRRMAFVPATVEWFPDMLAPNRGIVGRAPEQLRIELEAISRNLARRSREVIEMLGPLRPAQLGK